MAETPVRAFPVVGLLAAGFLLHAIWGKPWSAQRFHVSCLGRSLMLHPMLLSTTRFLRPSGLTFHEDDLGEFGSTEKLEGLSPEARKTYGRRHHRGLAVARQRVRGGRPR